MWMAGIALGAAALIAGFAVRERRLRKMLQITGIVVLLISLVYGGLVLLVLDAID